jgi:hypothetical protein
MRRNNGAHFFWIIALLLALSALGEGGSLPLQPGDALPSLIGQTLSGRVLDLPAATRGKAAVAIFSFSRAGGRDARNWAQHFSNDYTHLAIYNVIFLESVPRPLHGIVASRIRDKMPLGMQDQTLLLYQHQIPWEQRLHIQDENYACVVVIERTGFIRSISSGPFTESVYARVKSEFEP